MSFSGYPLALERREELQKNSYDLEKFRQLTQGDFPEEINPLDWHHIEYQKTMGSCQGFAQSSVLEMAYRIKTNSIIQFSPLFAYYATQKIDRLNGRDIGSTIAGGAQCATTLGGCPLELMPYPEPVRYNWHLPQNCIEAASKYKAGYQLMCKTYDDCLKFLGSGQGGILIGIGWNDSMTPDRNGYIKDCNTYGGGGHALAILGYTKEKDDYGYPYLWMANSWDVNWGFKGYAKISSRVVTKHITNPMGVFIGLSDLSVPDFRKVDYALW